MELTMLGTGSALVTECYNTCFVLQEDQQYFMVDGGGGSTQVRVHRHGLRAGGPGFRVQPHKGAPPPVQYHVKG